MTHELITEFGDPLKLIDRVPRTVSEVFGAWTSRPPGKSFNRRERNQRRWLAIHLEKQAARGEIARGVTTDDGRTFIAFWRVEPPDPAPCQRRVSGAHAEVRRQR